MGFFDKDLIEADESKGILGALQKFGNDIQEDLRNALGERGMQKTDGLGSSIVFDIEDNEGDISFELRMDDYGIFLDEGVTGVGTFGIKSENHKDYPQHQTTGRFSFKDKKPPLFENSALDVWSKGLGLNPYAVRESIFRKGLKQTNWFKDTMQGKVDELLVKLNKAGAKELSLSFSAGKLKGITK